MALPILNNESQRLSEVIELSTEINMTGFQDLTNLFEKQFYVLQDIKDVLYDQYESYLTAERERRENEREVRNNSNPAGLPGDSSSSDNAGGSGGSGGSGGFGGGLLGIGNIGKGIGKGLGGILKGLASGIAAFANPAVLLGGVNLGLVILGVGAAVAGATWMVGKSLPTMAEGMKSFQELDGDALIAAGKGMGAVALGMAAFGAGSAVAGLGSLVGEISEGIVGLFGGDDPLTKIQKFQEYNFDRARIENNSAAMVAYGKGMAAMGGAQAVSGIGAAVSAVGSGIAALFGAEDPLSGLIKFQGYTFDTAKIQANGLAVKAYAEAIKDFPQSPTASLMSSFRTGVASLLGGETDPMAPIKRFGDMTLNTNGIIANAGAVAAYAEAIKDFPASPSASVFTAAKDAIIGLLGGDTDPFAPMKAFGDLTFNTAGIIANAGAVAAYAVAMKDFPNSPSVSVFTAAKDAIIGLLGGDTDPFAPMKAFGDLTFNTAGIIANAGAVKAYAESIKDFPASPSASVFTAAKDAIIGLLGGDTDPFAPMKAFGDLTFNTAGIIANAGAVAAYAVAMKDFPASPSASVFTAAKDAIIGLLGGNTDPFAPMKAFGDLTFNTAGIVNNAGAVSAFATAMQNMPTIDATRTGGVLGAIAGWFAGDEQMPWDFVKAFGDAQINAAGVTANAEAINAMSTSLNNFSIEKLDTTGIISYTNAMENLVEVLGELNQELYPNLKLDQVAEMIKKVRVVLGFEDTKATNVSNGTKNTSTNVPNGTNNTSTNVFDKIAEISKVVFNGGPISEFIINGSIGKVISKDVLQTTLARNGEAIYQGSNEVSNLMNGGTTIIAPTSVSDNSVKNTTTTTMSGSSNVRTTDDSVRAFNSNPYM
jgi:hypothetical protein